MDPRNPCASYKSTEVKTASRIQLVVLLYEGALKHIRKGEALLGQDGRFPDAAPHLLRAMNIVTELLGVINPKASPELAECLSDLYRYVLDLIGRALKERDPAPLSEAAKVMSSLAEAWREIAQSAA